ncbi:MAG: ABC transporter permease [Actinobacteria bacterium]|nr:ABC transporter permease [Actinomycetota bacterium]MBW3642041.1 ABC transporter permease [Actinomycetota bacterium]
MTGHYALRRAASLVPSLLLVVTATFALVHLAPGNPVNTLAGGQSSAEYRASLEQRFGLDRPLPEQYLRYVSRLARGDLGRSIIQGRPVAEVILERVPATLMLVVPALVLSAGVGAALGIAASRRPGSFRDRLLMVGALSGQCTPVFVSGLVLVLVFSLWLGWLPVQGMRTARSAGHGMEGTADLARHLVLPVVTLTLPHIAIIARLTRSGTINELHQPYVTTARAKGVAPGKVISRHALPNTLGPVATAIGNETAFLLGGAVITERIFGWPGLGRLTLDAALARDYPVMLGVVLVVAVAVALVNLAVDLLYPVLDPRVRLR